MANDAELASASPPYERVPNISQYSFNKLFIISPNINEPIYSCSVCKFKTQTCIIKNEQNTLID